MIVDIPDQTKHINLTICNLWMADCVILHMHIVSDMKAWVGLCTEMLKSNIEILTCFLQTKLLSKCQTIQLWGAWLIVRSLTQGNLDPRTPFWLENWSLEFWVSEVSDLQFRDFRNDNGKPLTRTSSWVGYALWTKCAFWGMLIGKHGWVAKRSKNTIYSAISSSHPSCRICKCALL